MHTKATMLGAMTASAIALVAGSTAALAAPLPPLQPGLRSEVAQPVQYRRGYYRSGGYHYYNGHRGYNYYRPGYTYYNGWWFPGAAFAAGAVIGGALAAQPPVRYGPPPAAYGSDAHVQWCYSQYRSYRASDNTFKPYGAPRQPCVSPY